MKAGSHCMPEARPEATVAVQLVQIEVSPTHPLLLLKRALPWETITEVMAHHWREHGKNVDRGPGLPWDVSLYVPLVVLMLIKHVDSRQMEAYLAENVVARVFIGRHRDAQAQIRDHSNITRAWGMFGVHAHVLNNMNRDSKHTPYCCRNTSGSASNACTNGVCSGYG